MSFLVQWFYILTLSVWVGSIVFFSFFTTPTVFTQLPKEMASQFLSAIFPRYYYLGYFASGILLVTTLLEAMFLRSLPLIRLVLIFLMLGSTFYAGMVTHPQLHELKVKMKTVEEGSELGIQMKTKFDGLHRLSVALNLITLVAGLFLLGILAFRLRT